MIKVKSIIRRSLSKSVQFLFVLFALSITASAQVTGIHKTLMKRSLDGILPKANIPIVSPEQTNKARSFNRQAPTFTDRVWFPGEWEEVKAVVVTVSYLHLYPGHEDDNRYGAVPIVPGYARLFYQESED